MPVAPALAEEGTDPAKVLAVEQADGQGGQDVAPQAESTEVPVSDSGQTWNTGTHTVTA